MDENSWFLPDQSGFLLSREDLLADDWVIKYEPEKTSTVSKAQALNALRRALLWNDKNAFGKQDERFFLKELGFDE